jgi:hypothetical protein
MFQKNWQLKDRRFYIFLDFLVRRIESERNYSIEVVVAVVVVVVVGIVVVGYFVSFIRNSSIHVDDHKTLIQVRNKQNRKDWKPSDELNLSLLCFCT